MLLSIFLIFHLFVIIFNLDTISHINTFHPWLLNQIQVTSEKSFPKCEITFIPLLNVIKFHLQGFSLLPSSVICCPPPLSASLLRYLLPSSVMCCPPPLSFDHLSVMNVTDNILYSLHRGESSAAHPHRLKIKVSPIRMESIFHRPFDHYHPGYNYFLRKIQPRFFISKFYSLS